MDWPFGELRKGHYGCIVADPPWHFRARTALQVGNWTSRRDAEKHYSVMGRNDIRDLPVKHLAARDAHLFLWITGPMIVEGAHIEIMRAWGFKPSSVAFTWVKTRKRHLSAQLRMVDSIERELHCGLGLTTRKNTEFCLLGRRGNAKRIAKDVREIIVEPVREHSRKPNEEACARIERYCAGPYAYLFSRESRPGWDAWGDEAGKFDSEAAA